MNSQSGWPVYVLLGTLSLLCLIAVRTMQSSSEVELSESSDWAHIDSVRPPLRDFEQSIPFASSDSNSPWNDTWRNRDRGAARQGPYPFSGSDFATASTALQIPMQAGIAGGESTGRVVWQAAMASQSVAVTALPPTLDWSIVSSQIDHLRETASRGLDLWQLRLFEVILGAGQAQRNASDWLSQRQPRVEPIDVKQPLRHGRAPVPANSHRWFASGLQIVSAYGEQILNSGVKGIDAARIRIQSVPSQLAGFRRTRPAEPSEGQPTVNRTETAPPDPERNFEIRSTRPATWPYAEHLARRIESLPESIEIETWAESTQEAIDQLSHQDRLDEAEVESRLFALQDQLEALTQLLSNASPQSNPYQLRAVKYDLEKWITIWTLVHHAERHQFVMTQPKSFLAANATGKSDLVAAIDEVDRHLSNYREREAWREFLELDALRSWASGELVNLEPTASIDRVLTRTEMARLSKSQRELLQRPAFRQLQTVLRGYSDPQVDLSELMYLLEVYEQKPFAKIGTRVLSASRRLGRSDNPYLNKLSQIIELHYRNANVRMAISETLLNQMTPVSQPMAESVSDQVLGARVFGSTETTNQLTIQTVPNPRDVHLRLSADGFVTSQTRAAKGMFVFHNRGFGRFSATKEIQISPISLRVHPTLVAASNQNRTLGVQSNLDGFPLIGPLACSLAMQKQQEAAPIAKRIVDRKLASKAQQRIDVEVQAKLAEAELNLNSKILGPLDDLLLALEPVNFETTESRAVMRYRLAATDQLSAFSSRPRAYADSVMSFQMHQSAINNCLQRLDLAGQEFKIDELYAHLSTVLGREIPTPADMDPTVMLRFAPTDCIEVRFADGIAHLYLRFAQLSIGRANRWRNLTVVAEYQPRVDGIKIEFARDPESTLALQGRNIGFRDQMAIRTIFNKVFDPNLSLGVTPNQLLTDARFENLEVSQFELRDGWVGLSVEAR